MGAGASHQVNDQLVEELTRMHQKSGFVTAVQPLGGGMSPVTATPSASPEQATQARESRAMSRESTGYISAADMLWRAASANEASE